MSDVVAEAVAASAATIRARAPGRSPRIAIVLGSGWAPLADRLSDALVLPYADLPAFPALSVQGHSARLLLGRLGGREVAVLAGRKHSYETGDASAMKGAIRTLAAIGAQVLVQTNAAGSLAPKARPGELMLIADHLNLVQRSPLYGEAGSERFVDMRDAYCAKLRAQARRVAAQQGEDLHEGVYAWLMGPQFETPAEIRMVQALGATAVGMSTVPETILARHAGMRVLALSLLTNMGCGLEDEKLSHAHTLAVAEQGAARATALLEAIVTALEL